MAGYRGSDRPPPARKVDADARPGGRGRTACRGVVGADLPGGKDGQPPAAIVAPDLLFEPASYSAGYALGPEYLEARSEMAASLDEELARLSPEARAEVEENLVVIRNAIAEINAALEEEPTNPLLQQLLLNAYQDEFAVMHKVGGLTNRVMSRKDI